MREIRIAAGTGPTIRVGVMADCCALAPPTSCPASATWSSLLIPVLNRDILLFCQIFGYPRNSKIEYLYFFRNFSGYSKTEKDISGYPDVLDVPVGDKDKPSQKWDYTSALGHSQGEWFFRWNSVALAKSLSKSTTPYL